MPLLSPEHIHPILVNFTAALVPVSVASDVAGRLLKKPSLKNTGWWTLFYATCVTPLTTLAGLWWKHKAADGIPPDLLRIHQWLGISFVFVLFILCAWRWKSKSNDCAPSVPYLVLGVIAVGALMLQGEIGGKMLFGG